MRFFLILGKPIFTHPLISNLYIIMNVTRIKLYELVDRIKFN